MNRIYNTIWNEVRGTYVVAHEKSKSKGKPSSTRKGVVSAVAVALLSMAAGSAVACDPPITTATTSQIALGTGCSLNVDATGTNTGSVVVGSTAVAVRTGTVTGGITNSGTLSLISGNTIGVLAYGVATIGGGIHNEGTISGIGHGIRVQDHALTSGGITNSGTLSLISGNIAGISMYISSTISGGIHNEGTIAGGSYGVLVRTGSTVSGGITNSGSITGGTRGISIDFGSSVEGGITNSGLIQGDGNDAILIDWASTITGGITNSGRIVSLGDNGFDIDDHSTVSGGIKNIISGSLTGTISGLHAGIQVAAGAQVLEGILNQGLIQGNSKGVEVISGGIITGDITNSGTISGGLIGIQVLGSGSTIGTITNSGTISGGTISGYNIGIEVIQGHITDVISNTEQGVISGDEWAIKINNSGYVGGIANAGTIAAGVAIFLYDSSTISGGITNSESGKISGNFTGIYASKSSIGGITNSGTIIGGYRAIYVNNSSTISGGVLNQEGGKLVGGLFLGNDTNLVNDGTIVLESGVALADAAAAAVLQSTVAGAVENGIVSGNYTQGSTGVLRIGVESTGSYSQLIVGGNATLAGTLDVDVKTTTLSGSLFNVILAAGTITGTFAEVTDNSTLFKFTDIYDRNGAHSVDLVISAESTTGVHDAVMACGNDPATGAAGALDTIIGTDPAGPIASLFVPFSSQCKVSNAASQTLPLLTGGMSLVMGNVIHGTNRIIQARQEGQHGRSSGDEFFGDQHAWFKPFGSWANQDNRKGVAGYDANTYGMVFGADAEVSDNDRLGIAFAYAHSNVGSNSSIAPQSANVESYQLVAYGSHNISDATDISFQADIGQHNTEGKRSLGLLLPGQRAKSDYDSWSGHIGAGIAHTYTFSDKTTLTPSVRADYTRVRDESYSEKGAGALNLNVKSNTTEELILGVDGKLAHALTDKTTLTANLGLGYDVINEQASITAAFAGAPSASFVTKGLDPSPWLMRGGLGVVGKATETVEISARYDIEARKDFDNQTASVKVRWAF